MSHQKCNLDNQTHPVSMGHISSCGIVGFHSSVRKHCAIVSMQLVEAAFYKLHVRRVRHILFKYLYISCF